MSVLSIKVQGVDITDDVLIADAYFTMSVGQQPGDFSFRVKDPTSAYAFDTGNNVTVDIDGVRSFDGYILQTSKAYAFPVVDTSNPSQTTLMWTINGVDLNILFSKRVVYNQVDPRVVAPNLPVGTTDLEALQSLVDDYLDLTGDDLTFDFQEIGSLASDVPNLPFATGDTWDKAMAMIAYLAGGVWGIRPDRTVYYEDNKTESAPFRLSDVPNNSTTFGYSDLQWMSDGTNLVNDAPAWGASMGDDQLVYARASDATSITTHGIWQKPSTWFGSIYKQATIDTVSDSFVYGTPQNLHGGKDDAVRIACRIKKAGLQAGQKVWIESQAFGLSGVYPILSMRMTFATPTDVLYDLALTYEIDRPISLYDRLPEISIELPQLPPPWKPPNTLEVVSLPTWRVLRDAWDGGNLESVPPGWKEVGFDASGWDLPHDLGVIDPYPPTANRITPQEAFDSQELLGLDWVVRSHDFLLFSRPRSAVIDIYVDDTVSIYVNGVLAHTTGGSWGYKPGIILNPYLFAVGRNVLAFEVHNISTFPTYSNNPTNLGVRLTLSREGLPGTMGSKGCETPEQISASTFQTSYDFISGTLSVYRNGVAQRPVIDFTESPSNTKRFFLVDAFVSGESIYCCYNAQGEWRGGPVLREL